MRMTWVPCVLGVAAFVAELRGWQVVGCGTHSQGRGQEALREVTVAAIYHFLK